MKDKLKIVFAWMLLVAWMIFSLVFVALYKNENKQYTLIALPQKSNDSYSPMRTIEAGNRLVIPYSSDVGFWGYFVIKLINKENQTVDADDLTITSSSDFFDFSVRKNSVLVTFKKLPSVDVDEAIVISSKKHQAAWTMIYVSAKSIETLRQEEGIYD